jgi:hypothetical protein
VMTTTIMPAIIDKIPIIARLVRARAIPVSFLFNFVYGTFELTFKRLLSDRVSHMRIGYVGESLVCNYCAKRNGAVKSNCLCPSLMTL